MKHRILTFLLLTALAASGVMHVWEYRKIKEFSETFDTQSQIETKRTALFVIYQTVLQNVAKEIDELKKSNFQNDPVALELKFNGEE